MKSSVDLLLPNAPTVPKVPAWARPRGEVLRDIDAGYFAGSALNSLDNLVRCDAPWAGVWRQRLALKSAAAAVQLLGRPEDESALRDALLFRTPGDDPGPAGRVLWAWRRLAGRTTRLDAEIIRGAADDLELKWDDALGGAVSNAEDLVASMRPAPVLAAEIAAELYRVRPDAELLAFWLADLVLAQKFRWPVPVPLLIGQVNTSVFKEGESRRRIRPGGQGWLVAVLLAYARAAAEACELGGVLAVRATRLGEVAPKLRARGAATIITQLLNDDAVPASRAARGLSDRGARRLFERLEALGAVCELTGRPTFRLYGL